MMSVTNIGKDLSPHGSHGKKTIGGTAVQLMTTDRHAIKGIQLKAAAANANIIYVGTTPVVTAGTDDDFDGFPLSAGEGIFVPTDKTSKIYCIAGAAGQVLYWFAI